MRKIVFDSGPIISLGLSNLLWSLKPLRERFKGDFLITEYVHHELVDIPLKSKKFKLEAFQVEEQVAGGVLNIVEQKDIIDHTRKLMDIANNMFVANGRPISVVQIGEISTLAVACTLGAEAVVIDETATRQLVEEPESLARRLSHKLNTNVTLDRALLKQWRKTQCDVRVIRSVELATVAFELGLFDRYLPKQHLPGIRDERKELYDAILWSIKLAGCAVSEKELRRLAVMHK